MKKVCDRCGCEYEVLSKGIITLNDNDEIVIRPLDSDKTTNINLCKVCALNIDRVRKRIERESKRHKMTTNEAIKVIKNFLGILPDPKLDNEDDDVLDELIDCALVIALESLEKEIKS